MKEYKWIDFDVEPNIVLFIIFVVTWVTGIYLASKTVAFIMSLSLLCFGWSITFGTFKLKKKGDENRRV